MSTLSVRHLSKSFGGVRALNDVSFDVAPGEFLALIGPNGAGKSTCFNVINGQIAPDAGDVTYDGLSLLRQPPRVICKRGIGRTFQVASIFSSMTVRQNVQTALMAHAGETYSFIRRADDAHSARALVLLELVGLRESAERPCLELSYGDVKRLELVLALAGDPKLLLMDEPTAGMGSRERFELVTLVKRLVAERGISVLFTEHAMDVVFAFADRVIVLARGKLIAQGSVADIRDDATVREVYFGTGRTFSSSAAAR